jgi:hypothetical protein
MRQRANRFSNAHTQTHHARAHTNAPPHSAKRRSEEGGPDARQGFADYREKMAWERGQAKGDRWEGAGVGGRMPSGGRGDSSTRVGVLGSDDPVKYAEVCACVKYAQVYACHVCVSGHLSSSLARSRLVSLSLALSLSLFLSLPLTSSSLPPSLVLPLVQHLLAYTRQHARMHVSRV